MRIFSLPFCDWCPLWVYSLASDPATSGVELPANRLRIACDCTPLALNRLRIACDCTPLASTNCDFNPLALNWLRIACDFTPLALNRL
eukprot:9494305-Pyramimonas_sp.AAC.3